MSAQDARIDILFLIRAMGRGGAERQLSLLARTLHRRGVRVAVAVFYNDGAFEAELHAEGVPVIYLEKPGRWSNLGVSLKLISIIRRNSPRVLHSYLPTQNVLALVLRPFVKGTGGVVACGIRNSAWDLGRYSKVAAAIDLCQKMLIRFADRVIFNSKLSMLEMRHCIPPQRGFVVHNGVEHAKFSFCPAKRRSQRGAWGIPEDQMVIGLVGRLNPQKNHALLISALQLASERIKCARVVFVGDGPPSYRSSVDSHAQAAGIATSILWAGPSGDLAAVYSALDLFCLCSVVEGFPNVLAEAMCAGLPCVTTDVGDAAEVVGDCGWVVPSGDARALANALIQAHDALPSWDRDRPRRRVVENFSVDRLADRTLAALAPFLDEASG